MGIGWVLFAAGFVGMALFIYHLFGDYLRSGYNESGWNIKTILGILGFLVYSFGFASFLGMVGYKGYWKINSTMVFIEKGDNDDVCDTLKKIQQDISHRVDL